jgi:hypothetical protein
MSGEELQCFESERSSEKLRAKRSWDVKKISTPRYSPVKFLWIVQRTTERIKAGIGHGHGYGLVKFPPLNE